MKKVLFFASFGIFAVLFLVHPSTAAAACTTSQQLISIITRDAGGTLLPGINFTVYHQGVDPDGNPYVANSLISGRTDVVGQAAVCVATTAYPYAIKFYEFNANYGYTLKWNSALTNTDGGYWIEIKMSYYRIIIRDAEGQLIKNTPVDIYTQEFDVDGNPIVGASRLNQEKLVARYSTGPTGVTRAYLAAGWYVMRIKGSGNSYFYLWNQRIESSTEEVVQLEYKLSTLRVILEDALGGLLKNKTFSVYSQAYDARGQAIIGTVVGSMSTGTTGKSDIYLPPGSYAVRIPGSLSDAYYYSWKNTTKEQSLTRLTYRLSGIRVVLRDANGQLLNNQRFSIGEQGTDANGNPIVQKTLYTGVTGLQGSSDIYLTPKRYVLIVGDKKVFNLDVYNTQFTTIDWPRAFTLRPRPDMALTNPISNSSLTVSILPSANPSSLSVFKRNISTPYRINGKTIGAAYIIQFFYNPTILRQKGVNPDRLRVAYYNEGTKKWSLVGRNDTARSVGIFASRAKGVYILIEIK